MLPMSGVGGLSTHRCRRTPVLSLVSRPPSRTWEGGFWYYKLVGFLSVIVTSLGDRRCPFFLSLVSTGDYET